MGSVADRPSYPRSPVLCVWWLLLLVSQAAESAGGVPERYDEVMARLRAELAAERARADSLERRLAALVGDGAVTATRLAPRHYRSGALVTCPLVPVPNGSEPLPNGNFNRTCSSCFKFGDSLRCECFRRADMDPKAGLLLPRGNLTGLWSMQTNDWDSSTRLYLTTYDISDGTASFRILCQDGGVSYHCSTTHPGHNGTVFHAGQGAINIKTGLVHSRFDNLFYNHGHADANLTTLTWNDSSVWRRVASQVRGHIISHARNNM